MVGVEQVAERGARNPSRRRVVAGAFGASCSTNRRPRIAVTPRGLPEPGRYAHGHVGGGDRVARTVRRMADLGRRRGAADPSPARAPQPGVLRPPIERADVVAPRAWAAG